MKILKILILLFSLSTICFSSEYNHNKHIYKNLDYLNLDKHQINKIKEILLEYQEDYEDFYIEKNKKEKKLKELIQDNQFNEDKYEDILEDIYEELVELETEFIERIHRVLSKEQRQKFSLYIKEWRLE